MWWICSCLLTTTNPVYEEDGEREEGEEGEDEKEEEGRWRRGRGGGEEEEEEEEGEGDHEYELVGVSPGTAPPIAKAADKTYEKPAPLSHQPLPAIPLSVALPTGGDMGVAREREEKGVHDNIPVITCHVIMNVVMLDVRRKHVLIY